MILCWNCTWNNDLVVELPVVPKKHSFTSGPIVYGNGVYNFSSIHYSPERKYVKQWINKVCCGQNIRFYFLFVKRKANDMLQRAQI